MVLAGNKISRNVKRKCISKSALYSKFAMSNALEFSRSTNSSLVLSEPQVFGWRARKKTRPSARELGMRATLSDSSTLTRDKAIRFSFLLWSSLVTIQTETSSTFEPHSHSSDLMFEGLLLTRRAWLASEKWDGMLTNASFLFTPSSATRELTTMISSFTSSLCEEFLVTDMSALGSTKANGILDILCHVYFWLKERKVCD